MTHQVAVKQMAVERYLLGELVGESRDRFEEHLFDCQECAADLKQGVLFLEGARAELKSERLRVVRPIPQKTPSRVAWLWRPELLAPALAACLAVIVYQSAILLPHLKAEVAESQAPALLEPFVLANAGARGDSVPEIHVPKRGFYALSVDIPPAPNATAYRCSLYSPAGTLVWHVDVSPRQARDAIMIQVPVMTAHEGINELRVQSIASSVSISSSTSSSTGPENTLAVLASYRYNLVFQK